MTVPNGTAVALGASARVFAVSLGEVRGCSIHPTNPINPVAGRKTAAVPFATGTFSSTVFRATFPRTAGPDTAGAIGTGGWGLLKDPSLSGTFWFA